MEYVVSWRKNDITSSITVYSLESALKVASGVTDSDTDAICLEKRNDSDRSETSS